MTERYTFEEHPSNYYHDRHAGNVGDVWKHLVLQAIFDETSVREQPWRFFETHAGAGSYELGATGEWTEGVGRLIGHGARIDILRRFLELHQLAIDPREYLGSPGLIAANMKASDSAVLHEIQPDVAAMLRDRFTDPRIEIVAGDGIAALKELPESDAAGIVAIDPPWTAKRDWTDIPDAMIESSEKLPNHILVLWYPIKSYTRIQTMLSAIRSRNVRFTIFELLTSPLNDKKNRLNGSGMLVIRCPEAAHAAISEFAPIVGAACAVRGWWRYVSEHG